MKPAEGTYLLIARIGLVYYFAFLLILTPFISKIEKPKQLPASISDIFSDTHSVNSEYQKESN